jgi:hypothetical protein
VAEAAGGDPVGLGVELGVALAKGQGVGGGVGAAEAVAEAEAEALGLAAAGVAVGLGLAARLAVGLGVGLAGTVAQGVAGATRTAFDDPVDREPATSRAVGTTSMPRATAITKARAPHSWRQKAQEELRVSLRPAPAEVCCEC